MMLKTISRRAAAAKSKTAGPEPPLRIRRGFDAQCYDLQMKVESDVDGWKVRVCDQDDRALYAATERSLEAAKLAAAEFAVFRMTGAIGPGTVELVARYLPWTESS